MSTDEAYDDKSQDAGRPQVVQMEKGRFEIHQIVKEKDEIVGEVIVAAGTGNDELVEYWYLNTSPPEYTWPRPEGRAADVTTRYKYLGPVPASSVPGGVFNDDDARKHRPENVTASHVLIRAGCTVLHRK